MRILKLTEESRKGLLEELLKRSPNNYTQYEAQVKEIIDKVRSQGDEALFSYTRQFDGAKIHAGNVRVAREEIAEAYRQTDEKLIAVMKKSLANIRAYHEKQRQYSWFDSKPNGVLLGQKVSALARGVCAWREGSLSFFCADERNPGKGCRRRENRDDDALRQGWEGKSSHAGRRGSGRGG